MKTRVLVLATLLCLAFISCKKDDNESEDPPQIIAPMVFEDLIFNPTDEYFSTNGSMTQPVSESEAQSIVSDIDITFIWDFWDDFDPGFFDPVARSQEWNWDNFYEPWLSAGVQTQFYEMGLSYEAWDDAEKDQSKIAEFFADTSKVKLVQHGVYPEGSCIGGRQTYNPSSDMMSIGEIFGFKNVVTGKRGLLRVSWGQEQGWPMPLTSTDTHIDILKEH